MSQRGYTARIIYKDRASYVTRGTPLWQMELRYEELRDGADSPYTAGVRDGFEACMRALGLELAMIGGIATFRPADETRRKE